jgi:hypothetical protein
VPTDKELNALAAKASTPADHHSLEEHFQMSAKRYTADANEHVATATTYRGTRIAQAAVHCDRLVTLSRESAKEATAAAGMHKQLAGVPGKQRPTRPGWRYAASPVRRSSKRSTTAATVTEVTRKGGAS